MISNSNIYADRMRVDELKAVNPNLLNFLEQKYPRAVSDKDKIQFCGVLCSQGHEPSIFLPRGYRDANNGVIAKLLMQTIARFGNEVDSRQGDASLAGEEASLAATIHNIIADYLRYGLYSQRFRVASLNSGKPDWKRTLQRQLPMFTQSRKPVYASVSSSRFLIALENILAIMFPVSDR